MKQGKSTLTLLNALRTELNHVVGLGSQAANESVAGTRTSSEHPTDPLLTPFSSDELSQLTDAKQISETNYMIQTYTDYLRSSRLQNELTKKYFNKGERSVERSANLVGLELPKTYDGDKSS